MQDLENLLNCVKNKPITENIEHFTILSLQYHNKSKLFKILKTNKMSDTIYNLLFNLISNKNVSTNEFLIDFLSFLKIQNDIEWKLKIVFQILELNKNKKINNDLKLLILQNIKSCNSEDLSNNYNFLKENNLQGEYENASDVISVLNNGNISNLSNNTINNIKNICSYIFNFLLNENSSEIVYAILIFIPEIIEVFLKMCLLQTNTIVLKNVSLIVSQLSSTYPKLFHNYKKFEGFIDNELYYIRNCYLEIVFNQIIYIKNLINQENENDCVDDLNISNKKKFNSENINTIEELINDKIRILLERLNDVYFNVRYKSLCLIEKLFELDSIPLNIRNEVIKQVGDKILDKTIIVRKKSVQICNYILINNVFLTVDINAIHELNNTTDISSYDIKNENKEGDLRHNKTDKDSLIKYKKDLMTFHNILKNILKNVMILVNHNLQSEIILFLDFIKLCLFYEIEDSKEAFEQTFDLIWENYSIINIFKEIIINLKYKKISIISFLKKFTFTESYSRIIFILNKKRIINLKDELINDILRNKDLRETSFLLYSIKKNIEFDTFYNILQYVTNLMFNVTQKEELDYILIVYCNILKLKLNERIDKFSYEDFNNDKVSKNKKEGNINNDNNCLENDGRDKHNIIENINDKGEEIINLIIKNILKMVFFDYQVLENTVNFIYKNTLDPEQACKSLLIMLEKKNLNILKSIYIVGCVGINHLRYLEILERKYKERNEKINIEIPEEIKERRKSINASRLSLMIDDGDENDSKIIKLNDNFVMENKSEEEIADFFFYLKEKDILYNPDGLLYEYSKKIIEYTNIKELEEVAIISLYKLMCISSEFFTEYKHFISKGFKSDNYKIRSNCIISIGDFLLLYNSMVDEINILFEGLIDTNKIVRKNALLVIYNLLKRNILRLGNKSIYLSNLIFDEDEEIKLISRNIIYNMSENDNFIVTLVYEKFVKEINNSDLDFFLPLLKEKSREMIFLKLIKTSQNKDMLKVMYNKFNMSEKFINDIKHMEEFKILGVC